MNGHDDLKLQGNVKQLSHVLQDKHITGLLCETAMGRGVVKLTGDIKSTHACHSHCLKKLNISFSHFQTT